LTITSRIKTQLGAAPQYPKNWVFLGMGYCAKALINHLPPELRLTGTSRAPDAWPDDLKARVKGIKFDGDLSDNMNGELRAALKTADVVIISLPPSAKGDPFLHTVKGGAASLMPRAQWVCYLSATSVYGDRAGGWVYEHEPPQPKLTRGLYRAEAEMSWLETGLPVHIFRLAGIYGGDYFGQSRNPFKRLELARARAVIKPGHIVNRIHAEDIVQAVLLSLMQPRPLRIYNLADGHPAPPQDVLRFAARLCGADMPPETSVDSPDLSDMARSFYAESKRISNHRAQAELGWRPEYPHYQKGLLSIYKSARLDAAAVCLAGHIDAAPKRRAIIKEALPRHIKLSRREPGCLRFDITQDEPFTGRYHLVEVYKNKAAFEAHKKRSAASDWAEAAQGLSYDVHII